MRGLPASSSRTDSEGDGFDDFDHFVVIYTLLEGVFSRVELEMETMKYNTGIRECRSYELCQRARVPVLLCTWR